MATKSSHSPRRARPSRSRSRSSRARSSSAPKPAGPPAPQNTAGQPETLAARPQLETMAKREIEVRRIPIATQLRDCPRCANRHDSLEVKPLTRWPDGFTHFAICPNLGEPILLTVAGA